MGKEHLGESGLIMECANDCILLDPHDLAPRQRRRVRDALRLSGQASLAAKFILPENRDHGLSTECGNDCDFELALLDVKNRIRDVSLRKNLLTLVVFENRSPLANFGQEVIRIKPWGCTCQWNVSSLGHAQTTARPYVILALLLIMSSLRGCVGNKDDRIGRERTFYMFAVGERGRAPGPTDNIHNMPLRRSRPLVRHDEPPRGAQSGPGYARSAAKHALPGLL